MDILFKISGAALIGLVLLVVLEKQEKHIALLLALAICGLIIVTSLEFLQPVVSLIRQLQRTAQLKPEFLTALLKSAGTGIVCEITALICTEAGYSSLGKTLQFTGACMILYFSLPLFSSLLALTQELLGGL